MFRRIKNWFRRLIYKNPVTTPPQKAPVEVIKDVMTNPVVFGGETHSPLLTVNAVVRGGTLKQRDFMRNVLNVLRHVVISDMLQDRVLEYNFHNPEMNNLEVYKLFLSGKDAYEAAADGEMDIDVTLYSTFNNVLGYTYPNNPRTWINMSHFQRDEYEIMAKAVGNIVHEYMHNLNFNHTHHWTPNRQHTIPYAYGYIARDVAMEFLRSGRDIASFEEWTGKA